MILVKLFSDGSCLGNPGVGGWAYILEYKEHKKSGCGGEFYTTNNKMEIKAVIEGLKNLKFPCEVELYTDSSYVANAINSWLSKWVVSDFKNKENADLWREYLKVSVPHKITAFWIKAHAGHPQNELCDEMARSQALKLKG